jgi:hypothetical protein
MVEIVESRRGGQGHGGLEPCSVYHPHLNVYHNVMNQRGICITNTISRAERTAIVAATIHGYSHIATDSLTLPYKKSP